MLTEQSKLSVSQVKTWIEGSDPRNAHLRLAMFIAVLLHLVLAALMPSLPDFTLPASSRGSILNVFINNDAREKKFEQSLNNPVAFPNADEALLDPVLGSASPDAGEQSTVSEATPDQLAQSADSLGDKSAGKVQEASIQTVIRTDLAYIRMFARQEAARHAEQHPEEVERFRRTFNSQRNYRRRNKTESFKDRYGDYYVRASSSSGDVCFLQRPGENRDEMNTNIVYFYRCDSEPIIIDIDSSG